MAKEKEKKDSVRLPVKGPVELKAKREKENTAKLQGGVKPEKLNENPVFVAHEPRQKEVFCYDPVTREYAGTTSANECQVEKDVFHVPANATEKAPKEAKDGYAVCFDADTQDWYYRKKEAVKPAPVKKEDKTEYQLGTEVRAKRDLLLKDSDWTQLPDANAGMTEHDRNAWTRYRQELRDITKQKGFPRTVEWPKIVL